VRLGFVLLVAAFALPAAACPVDGASGPPGTLLTVHAQRSRVAAFGPAELAALPRQDREQRRTVSGGASAAAGVEQSVRYGGVLLRDVLERALADALKGRDARRMVFDAIATDGYRAVFSWGELFNGAAGEQALVILVQDGQPLSAYEGPLALRALGDLRPGPRHVRNLCALVVRGE
jgi:hypothetical protein